MLLRIVFMVYIFTTILLERVLTLPIKYFLTDIVFVMNIFEMTVRGILPRSSFDKYSLFGIQADL
jgi:hypothetical protein